MNSFSELSVVAFSIVRLVKSGISMFWNINPPSPQPMKLFKTNKQNKQPEFYRLWLKDNRFRKISRKNLKQTCIGWYVKKQKAYGLIKMLWNPCDNKQIVIELQIRVNQHEVISIVCTSCFSTRKLYYAKNKQKTLTNAIFVRILVWAFLCCF